MIFSEALERLPESTAYTLHRDGANVAVWFLYWQDAEESWDPDAEDGPRVEVQGSNVVGGGFGMHKVQDWMKAEHVPEHIREEDWKEAPIDRDEFPMGEDPATILHALNGVPVEEAKQRDEWPEELREVAPTSTP